MADRISKGKIRTSNLKKGTVMPYREDLFTHVINNLAAGKVAREASEKLNELVNACRETTKKGTLTIKLTVKPDKAGEGQYEITPDVNADVPNFGLPSTHLWGTPDGNLQTHHPDQGNLNLKTVTNSDVPKEIEEKPTETKSIHNR